jgi:hypothetical protein
MLPNKRNLVSPEPVFGTRRLRLCVRHQLVGAIPVAVATLLVFAGLACLAAISPAGASVLKITRVRIF